jgi:hygromycin-B 7''-O-kinase
MITSSAEQPADAREYSSRLGRIAPAQFQAALDRFNLGQFVGAAPVRGGNFGQVLFLTSTSGAWVLRGSPLLPGQFREERFFARLLHERTDVPAPWPYLLDETTDIFGWHYVIMPRLPGLDLEDETVATSLTVRDRHNIARALGTTLARMQELTWPVAGTYDAVEDTIHPFAEGHAAWIVARIREHLAQAREHTPRLTTLADARWVEEVIARGWDALQEPFRPRVVMQDYKDQNVVVERVDNDWQVSGVFDLMGLYFGDGEVALCRQLARGNLVQEPALADEFLRAYAAIQPLRPGVATRLPVYALDERLAIWEWAHRTHVVWWDANLTLRAWAVPFIAAVAEIALTPARRGTR